ncbi:ankyrin repeat domain-containing protein 13D-like [Limulus polyphemus]|uniref:Ankyrin repeat domain-containing protein 13D-like n=1 Tax=Limulus polyphemus TaxID=6850 RepID=A0ABM1AZH9_LIMPO|nr:ankyrin repeat domain-containing protein 13D-like [Limulus polyphemus]
MTYKSRKRIKMDYLIHWHVWHNNFKELGEELDKNEHDIERKDPRGRTPLMLAVTLGHLESARIMLRHNADLSVTDRDGFTVIHEAVSTGNPELVQEVLEQRDFQRYCSRVVGIPQLLKQIQNTPDFYVEMKWEFTSWVPLVSRMCPSDTYRVYKSGSSVRIDTSLLGFDHSNWQRGSRSYIFKSHNDGAVMMEVDHDVGQVYIEQMSIMPPCVKDFTTTLRPTSEAVSTRLTTPIVTTFVNLDKICFERSRSGIWGWRSNKTEMINGYECKVFGASNVELVTRTRTEHLTDVDKTRHKSARSPFQSFLGIVESENRGMQVAVNGEAFEYRSNPCHITPEEYFDSSVDLGRRDIGRPREISTKVQKFKANLWLCQNFPLSLKEQILPIVDLMAISSSHFAKLRDFITLQLPNGFPVKIEIPIFHVLNARITFENIYAMDDSVAGVTSVRDDSASVCLIDENCFEPPHGYIRLGSEEFRHLSIESDDDLLQLAVQQSLLEAGSEEEQVTIWEALRAHRPISEDRDLQRVFHYSMADYQNCNNSGLVSNFGHHVQQSARDSQLSLALQLSHQAALEEDNKRKEEEEQLARVIQLSLSQK